MLNNFDFTLLLREYALLPNNVDGINVGFKTLCTCGPSPRMPYPHT